MLTQKPKLEAGKLTSATSRFGIEPTGKWSSAGKSTPADWRQGRAHAADK
jgi:hypothetical protein